MQEKELLPAPPGDAGDLGSFRPPRRRERRA